MSGARELEFISLKAQACTEAFDNCDWRSQYFLTTDLQDQCGRFHVWAATTGVFAHPRASLDFRLREVPEIREMITGMLTVILQSITSVEKLSNTHAKPSSSIDATATLDHGTKKEIAENIESISDDIGLLYRLSYTIRQASAERVYQEATAESRLTDDLSQSFKRTAHQYVTENFQISSEALRERLVSAMLIRFNRFRYLQERYRDEPEIYPHVTRLDQNSFRRPPRSSRTSSSSEHELLFPAPPQACNGTQATCPYCLITLPATDFEPEKWNEHLRADLDPYVCLNERCELPPDRMLFERRQDWIDHMRQSHLLKWRCRTEDHEETFNTESDFLAHLQGFHAGDFEDDDLPLLAEMSARPIGPTFKSCPLCGTENMRDDDLENHISNHLFTLALLSLPPRDDIEENEHESVSSIKTHESTGKPIPFHMSTTKGANLESPRLPQLKEGSISTPPIDKKDPSLASEAIVRSTSGSDLFRSPEQTQRQADQLSTENIEQIKAFTREIYPRSCNYGDKNRVPLRSRNTCEWFLEHPRFLQWQQSTQASALWVTADAGCGKSVLAKFLIEQLLSNGHIVIHFFFRDFRYSKNVLLCALLHQLLKLLTSSTGAKSSRMLHMLCQELQYKTEEQVMREDETIWNIICNAATGSEGTSPKLFCVIDGLDECPEPSRSQFIDHIVSTFSSSGTAHQPHQPPNFLITSRPYAVIEERFRPLSRIRLRLENETPAISKDIETMIADKTQSLNPTRFPSEIQVFLYAETSRRAGQTFLWIELVFNALEQLERITMEEIRKILDTNPSEPNVLYEYSLSRTSDKERTRRLLLVLAAAPRPLSLDEVNIALQLQDTCVRFEDINPEPDIEGAMKRLCGSVIRIIDSTVDFIHQTAKEFLISSQSTPEKPSNLAWGASIDLIRSHCLLGSICLRFLSLIDWDEMPVREIETEVGIAHRAQQSHDWVTRHGRLPGCVDNGSQSKDSHSTDSASHVHKELGNTLHFCKYARDNWPRHSEEVLKGAPRTYEVDPEFRQLEALLTSLRESGMSTIQRCTITTAKLSIDPFIFLEEEGFHFVVNWFLNGPRIEGYTVSEVTKTLCDALEREKDAFFWSLLQYATTTIGVSEQDSAEEKGKWFSRVANEAARKCRLSIIDHLKANAEMNFDFDKAALHEGLQNAVRGSDISSTFALVDMGAKDDDANVLLASLEPSSCNEQIFSLLLQTQDYHDTPERFTRICPEVFSRYLFYQDDRSTEHMEIFQAFLRCLLDLPLGSYLYVLFEAIRWRHPSVADLIQSRMELIRTTKRDNVLEPEDDARLEHDFRTCALQEAFSVACRYGSPAASLLFEHSTSAIGINRADVFGITPLIAAILAGDYYLCEWVLRKKANVNVWVHCVTDYSRGDSWATKLALTVPQEILRADGFPNLRAWKWSDYYPDIPSVWRRYGDSDFVTCPLSEAIRVQNLLIFGLLLEYGADPWNDDLSCGSILAAAASHSEIFFDRVVGFMMVKEVGYFDINRPETHSKRTLIHVAARSSFYRVVMKLISYGSAVNVPDAMGRTPLHEIASNSPSAERNETFQTLVVDHDADANVADNAGKTPLSLMGKTYKMFHSSPVTDSGLAASGRKVKSGRLQPIDDADFDSELGGYVQPMAALNYGLSGRLGSDNDSALRTRPGKPHPDDKKGLFWLDEPPPKYTSENQQYMSDHVF